MVHTHFFYKMLPPRADFHVHQSDHEQQIMQRHMEYWQQQAASKKAIVFGPVFDPAGVYGMAIIATESRDDAEMIAQNDPAISEGLCAYELAPMRAAGSDTTGADATKKS